MANPHETLPNVTPDALMKRLTATQKKYVLARQEYTTKKDAAEAIGINPKTVYRWPGYVEEAVELVARDVASAAMAELQGALFKAARKKVEEMDSGDPTVAAKAATEILDRFGELGKPKQRQEIEHSGSIEETHDLSAELEALAAAGSLPDAEEEDE